MTDPVPSKELPATLPASSYDGDLWVKASGVMLVLTQLTELRRENVRWENAHKILLAEIERLKRPAHEREPPHCSSCACGLPVRDGVVAVIQAELDAKPGDGAPPLADRIATALAGADLLWREGELDEAAANPFDQAKAVFAGKKGDGYLLKCWFDTQEDLDRAFEVVEGASQPPGADPCD